MGNKQEKGENIWARVRKVFVKYNKFDHFGTSLTVRENI
jgi:hypothetical protein